MFGFLRRAHEGPQEDQDARAARAALLRILELNKEMALARSPAKLPEVILDAAIELVGAERGFLLQGKGLLADSPPPASPGEELSWDVVAARNIDRENVRQALKKLSHSIASQVLVSGRSFRSDDAVNDESWMPSASVAELKLRSVLCVPLRLGRLAGRTDSREGLAVEVVGCLYVDNRFAHGQFDQAAEELLGAFADQAALALERVHLLADNERGRERLEQANQQLRESLRDRVEALDNLRQSIEPEPAKLVHEYASIIGRGRAISAMLAVVDRVTQGDYPILLCGESGTGKELVARALHANGPRKKGPFVGVNCGAIAEGILESELFGAVRGAYTGAFKDRPGLFEAARGGVIFLDEVGEMSLALQKKLLRVLQEGRVRRVGGNEEVPIDARILSATHRDIDREVAEGRFREDLYYRLKVVQIDVPPLRERREDIPALVDHILERIAAKSFKQKPRVSQACLERLISHDWPGNVRELENELTRMVALGGDDLGPELVSDFTPVRRTEGGARGLVGKRMAEVEAELIRATLEATGGRRGEAARMLGIPRRTFYNRLKALGIE